MPSSSSDSTAQHPLIFLWCVPRSRSTAFEKMMVHAGGFDVVSEPFIDTYKTSLRSDEDRISAGEAFDDTFANLTKQSSARPVFVKDMAYHAAPFISDAQIRAAQHSFLIRDPAYSIPSLYKMRPAFTADQPGFAGMVALLQRIKQVSDQTPFVFDAESLVHNPENTVAQYFHWMGRAMPDDILSWPSGSRDAWAGRESWHLDAIASEGFNKYRTPPDLSGLPPEVLSAIEQNQADYECLKQLSCVRQKTA